MQNMCATRAFQAFRCRLIVPRLTILPNPPLRRIDTKPYLRDQDHPQQQFADTHLLFLTISQPEQLSRPGTSELLNPSAPPLWYPLPQRSIIQPIHPAETGTGKGTLFHSVSLLTCSSLDKFYLQSWQVRLSVCRLLRYLSYPSTTASPQLLSIVSGGK